MGDEHSQDEQKLLARLNALKPSHVSLDASKSKIKSDVQDEVDDTPDELITRFQSLYGRKSGTHKSGPDAANNAEEQTPPSPTIEELLAELETTDTYKLEESDQNEARDLIAQAKTAMSSNPQESKDTELPAADQSINPPNIQSKEDDEDAEAQAALQRILDEDQIESNYHEDVPDGVPWESSQARLREKSPITTFSALQFPSVDDNVIDSLNLPSVPTKDPSISKKAVKPKVTGFSDEEINSWCIICCNNASVQCFGCDKDLYCWGCWREGHTGESAGPDERHHVWERYKKPKTS